MASVQRELLGVGWLAAEVLARGNTRGHAGTRGDAWGRVGTRGDAWGRVGKRGSTWGHAGARGGDVVTRGHQHEVSMGTLCVFFTKWVFAFSLHACGENTQPPCGSPRPPHRRQRGVNIFFWKLRTENKKTNNNNKIRTRADTPESTHTDLRPQEGWEVSATRLRRKVNTAG